MMHRAKGLDDLFQIDGQPRLRRFHHAPPEVAQRRRVYGIEARGAVSCGGRLQEVRDRVASEIGAFVGAKDLPAKALLVRAAPGTGKSTATSKSIRKHRVQARIVVGTKVLAREMAETHGYALIEGRNRDNCERYDVVKALGESGHRVEALACGDPSEPRCPFYARCKYSRQFMQPGTRVAATEQLFNRTFLEGGELAVVDDAELPRAMLERWSISSAVLERAAAQLADEGHPAVLVILTVLRHALVDAPEGELLGAHTWDHFVATAARYDQDFVAMVEALPEHGLLPEPADDEDGCVSVQSVEAVPPATLGLVLHAFKQELADFLRGEDFNSHLALSRDSLRVGRMRPPAVDRRGRVMLDGMGLLVLDATPLPVLVDYLCQEHECLPDVDGDIELPANVTVVQYAAATNSHSTLPKGEQVNHVLKQVEQERGRLPAASGSDEALIAYKGVLARFADAGFAEGQMLSFGAVRGSNAVENVRRLHVVGRPFPPTSDLHFMAQIIHRRESYVSPELVVVPRQFGNQPFAVDVVDYADTRMSALLHAHRESELVQVIHRARPFILEAQKRLDAGGVRESVTLVIHTSHPIPGLRVDRLIVDGERQRDVNEERHQDAEDRVRRAAVTLAEQGGNVTIDAVAREAGASWRTVQKVLGNTLHTFVGDPRGAEESEEAGEEPRRGEPENLGNTLHTPLRDLLRGVQSCPQNSETVSRPGWLECAGGCGTLMPPGQKCFECAARAVAEWVANKKQRRIVS